PNDQQAAKSLRAAMDQLEASKAPVGPTPAQVAEYNKQMAAGAAFDKQKKWEDAKKAYDAALKQIPKDTTATKAFNKASYNYHMAEGDKQYAAKRYVDAAREYEAALALFPKDPDATKSLKKAKDAK